ncbi:MAG: PepSY domain-containing protein [Candidatus Marinimicrobia bacterium]|nr:PepSY domain-containing protein [Candidatus Neomarinimicrobiota bacterium]MBT3675480.1 PepSY domain-containing protein [Candidatus Neomarinimicrobiota bacterium]MBT3762808.1 PepSY domain-containing protein [Candidatus Neomarinimicrobiota bacterium]MBT4069288.1 PepSY domain-containing protein [Candidatus Neomarinimicrobiota bacterium]MBT4270429.1 PepSY domain-containing protein [Candidatus Neomarinimicrobiota bacterium]
MKKRFNWNKWTRKTHYWGAFVILLPVSVIFTSGIFLQLKKEINWIQPPTVSGGLSNNFSVSFDDILAAVQSVEEAKIQSWNDVDRLDVRVEKGVVKVRGKNRWEVQVDTHTGEVLHVAYRRSDLIESIHDGSWFHEKVKLWIFLPSGIILLTLWITGLYMVILPYTVKWKRKRIK